MFHACPWHAYDKNNQICICEGKTWYLPYINACLVSFHLAGFNRFFFFFFPQTNYAMKNNRFGNLLGMPLVS